MLWCLQWHPDSSTWLSEGENHSNSPSLRAEDDSNPLEKESNGSRWSQPQTSVTSDTQHYLQAGHREQHVLSWKLFLFKTGQDSANNTLYSACYQNPSTHVGSCHSGTMPFISLRSLPHHEGFLLEKKQACATLTSPPSCS